MNEQLCELSVLITSLPFAADISLAELARQGFRHVDLIGKVERPEAEREALADSGLIVDCVALGRDLPDGCSLDASEVTKRRQAVEVVQRQIVEAAQIGARVGYVVPCKDAAGLSAFADSCQALTTFAMSRMMTMCIEHFPGSALPTARETLNWLETMGPNNMKLVLDLGHCLISHEDPSEVATDAGAWLGYVQLDDNDGINDVHWPLLSGALTEVMLRDLLHRLRSLNYRGGVALELNGSLEEPLRNVVNGKRIVEGMWGCA